MKPTVEKQNFHHFHNFFIPKSISKFCQLIGTTMMKIQGDQIGPILALWAIV
jgi:hypothetical protein